MRRLYADEQLMCEDLLDIWYWRHRNILHYFNKSKFYCSYMDTEKYDEAVYDYEKIYKMDKNRGMKII